MLFWKQPETHKARYDAKTHTIQVKMRSPYQYDITTHHLFDDIANVARNIPGYAFVVYDMTDFTAPWDQLDLWLQAQGRGARGSITDKTLQTILVGEENALRYLSDQFRQAEYSCATVGICATLTEATDYAQDAMRVFASWYATPA